MTESLIPSHRHMGSQRSPLVITDAQVHVWMDSTPERPWPPMIVEPQREPALGVEELLEEMDTAGVSRALLVPPTWEGPRNDLVIDAAARHPDRFAALGRVDPTDPAVVAGLRTWRENPGLLGIRMSINRGDRQAQIRAAMESGFFAQASEHQIPLSMYVPGTVELVDQVAVSFPELRLTVDHLALDSRERPLADAVEPVMALASRANVSVKASALPCFIEEQYPFASIGPVVSRLVSEFGAERVFWGSDLSRLPCTYTDLVSAFVDHLALSEHEMRMVMGEGLSAWLGWPQVENLPTRTSGNPATHPGVM